MNSTEFIRRVRKAGRRNGVSVTFSSSRGKGSHGELFYGKRHTTVPKKNDIGTGLLHAMLRDLGLERGDI